MITKIKKRLGIQAKNRTAQDLGREYDYHALQAGHKTRLLNELLNEIEEHTAQMKVLADQAKKLPPPSTPDTANPVTPQAPEPMPAAAEKTDEVAS